MRYECTAELIAKTIMKIPSPIIRAGAGRAPNSSADCQGSRNDRQDEGPKAGRIAGYALARA